MFFCHLLIVFKTNFFEKYFRNIITVSNSLDPDQIVRHDLVPNCLQRFSADNTPRQRVYCEQKNKMFEFFRTLTVLL